ncbi:MAG: hypothetical protein ACRDR6_14150 [Pseudonocardiaceae bacterium]
MSRFPDGISAEVITVVARRVLLDALEALQAQRDAITLVGAQAVHLRTAASELTTASYTSDADLGVDPEVLDDEPLLEQTMTAAGFTQGPDPGRWYRLEKIGDRIEEVVVDLMVAEKFSGSGSRRSGVIPPHSRDATRRTLGLEPAAVDYDVMAVPSLEPERDGRVLDVRVAGVAALLIAKCHKLGERVRETSQRRVVAKDAGDVVRLMLATDAGPVRQRLELLLADPRAADATRQGLDYLAELFGAPRRQGVVMAIDALSAEVDADQVRALAPAYAAALRRTTTG